MDESLIVADYLSLRAASKELSRILVKNLRPTDLMTAARQLNMVPDGRTIMFNNEAEMNVLMDFAIHEISHDGLNVIDRTLRDQPPAEGSLEMRILPALRKARYSLLEITKVTPGFGMTVEDKLNNDVIRLVDIGFSETVEVDAAMAGRIYSPSGDWWMSTGASLPLTEGALIRIEEEFKLFQAAYRKEPVGHDRTRLIIKACIAAKTSQFVQFSDPGSKAPVSRGR